MLETYILPAAPPEGVTENIKPGITVLESTNEYASVALEPLVPGFAHTIGNPLRRFLLSSIKGSAITWVKIDNVVHEYTAIEGVKEEVMDLLLNIKRIRIHAQSERTGKMRLDVQGEGRVCAGDIATSATLRLSIPSCTWRPWMALKQTCPLNSTWNRAWATVPLPSPKEAPECRWACCPLMPFSIR